MWVSSITCGGIGNVLFQVASGYGIAKANGHNYYYDRTLRHLSPHLPNPGDEDDFLFRLPRMLVTSAPEGYVKYSERSFQHQQVTLPHGHTGYVLEGYFQSPKYFDYCKGDIKSLLKPVYTENFSYDGCAIHIRRGDYLKHPDYHHNLELDYYFIAMQQMKAKKYVIFSDDPEWCKKVFKGNDFEIYLSKSPYNTLRDMSRFKQIIIANSTFSWWVAYLSDATRIIAPSKWFGPQGPQQHDLIPTEWETI